MELPVSPRSSMVVCAAAVAMTLAAATACGGDDDDGLGGAGAHEERAVSLAGEPVRDGFEVVEGSEMIGPAFPIGVAYMYNGEPVVDDGFRALFVVRDDPRPVIEGYLGQARDLGLTEAEGPSCGEHDYVQGVFACTGFARTADDGDLRSVRLSFHRGRVGEAQGFSHLELRYSTTPIDWQYGGGGGDGGGGGGGGADAGPEAPSPPDDVDQPVDGDTLFAGWASVEPVDVLEGSRQALQMPTDECTAFTPLAVLEVTGDPETVLDAYADRLATAAGDVAQPQAPLEVAGGRLLNTYASAPGGGSYGASLYDTGSADWLLIDSCSD